MMEFYEEEKSDDIEEINVSIQPRAGHGQFPYNPNEGQMQVLFPYEPYESQKMMMDAIDKGLHAQENCLLESPTGAGKTAALLCGPLAWRREQIRRYPDVDPPVIIYATRTQCQIQHVVDQLKQTVYADTPMTVFASRIHTCLNESALKSTCVDEKCEVMRANSRKSLRYLSESKKKKYQTCPFYERFDENQFVTNFLQKHHEIPWDIEDLKRFSRGCGMCPYYGIKALQARAGLILCTYNHLLHKWIRRSVNLQLTGSVVIFDEGHNIESVCCDIASKNISRKKLEEVILGELACRRVAPGIPKVLDDILRAIQVPFQGLLRFMYDKRPLYPSSVPIDKDEILRTFTSYGFGPVNVKQLEDDLGRLYSLNNDGCRDYSKFTIAPAVIQSMNSIVYTFHMLFERTSAVGANEVADFGVDLKTNGHTEETELCITCLDPKVVFNDMRAAKTLIVTSGTLSPLHSYASELGILFPHTIVAPHTHGRVISSVISLSKWNNEVHTFNFTYSNQQDVTQIIHLGNLLRDLCKIIPNGILVFVSSKEYTRKLREIWQKEEILRHIMDLKQTFWEYESNAHTFSDFIGNYRKAAQCGEGAIMFAVFRGRISEGMDFPDAQARAVVTIGIPYLPLKEPKVVRKRAYNDEMFRQHPERGYLRGFEWYSSNAFRAFNQAVGRCIRHRKDWGMILMVDDRLADYNNFSQISSWVTEAEAYTTERSLEALKPLLQKFVSKSMKEQQ